MLTLTLLFILSALTPLTHSAPALVPRTCYLSGSKWEDGGKAFGRDLASRAVDSLCEPEKLGGVYQGNQVKTACVQLRDDRVADFAILWMGPERSQNWSYNFTLSAADCKARLRDEIYGCEHGGQTDYDRYPDWYRYKEPNRGEWTFK